MSHDLEAFRRPGQLEPAPGRFTQRGRKRHAAVVQYEADEIDHAVETHADVLAGRRSEAVVRQVGAIGGTGVAVADRIAEMRDRVIEEHGQSVHTIEVDAITQQVQAVVAEVTTTAMRRHGERLP
jgi:hypothetical protein